MRILITGGKGQLGLALTQALGGHNVSAPGHSELDITDAGSVSRAFAELSPEIVIHAAAWTDTAGCERDPARALEVNAGGTDRISRACEDGRAALVYVSSNEVFDGEKGTPYLEDDEPRAINEYGRSKLEGEVRVRDALERHWIVRTSWLYGPGRVSFPEKIARAARDQGRLRVVTDEIASPTYTIDIAGAIARLIGEASWGVYHLANADSCTRKEWASELLRLSGMTDVPVEDATQADFGASFRKPVNSTLANVKAAGLGVELRHWREALAEYVARSGIQAGTAAGAGGQR